MQISHEKNISEKKKDASFYCEKQLCEPPSRRETHYHPIIERPAFTIFQWEISVERLVMRLQQKSRTRCFFPPTFPSLLAAPVEVFSSGDVLQRQASVKIYEITSVLDM